MLEVEKNVLEIKKHVLEAMKHVLEGKTHVLEVKKHVLEVKKHVLEVKKHVLEGKKHVLEVKKHVLESWCISSNTKGAIFLICHGHKESGERRTKKTTGKYLGVEQTTLSHAYLSQLPFIIKGKVSRDWAELLRRPDQRNLVLTGHIFFLINSF